MRRRKIYIFEKIGVVEKLLISWCTFRGHGIKIFDFGFQTKKNTFTRPLANQDKIDRIYITNISISHKHAIDLTNEIFPHIQHDVAIEALKDIYQDPDTSFIFRKGLVADLFHFYFIHDYLTALPKRLKDADIVFIAGDYGFYKKFLIRIDQKIGTRFKSIDGIRIHYNVLTGIEQFLKSVSSSVLTLGYACCKAWCCQLGRLLKKPRASKIFRQFLVIIGSRFEVEHAGDRGYDFILDEKNFTNETVGFVDISGLGPALLERERNKGRFIIDLKAEITNKALLSKSWDTAFLKPLFKGIFKLMTAPSRLSVLRHVAFIAVKKYFDWHIVLQRVETRHLVYSNQESLQMSSINLVMRHHGVTTWNYSCFLGGNYIMAINRNWEPLFNIHWSYLLYDHAVGFNTDVASYYQQHSQCVKAYHAVGSLYSQLIHQKQGASTKTDFIKTYFPKIENSAGMKLITVFDTSVMDTPECLTTYDDCILFYDDMMKLIERRKDCLFFFKPAKSPTFFINPDHPCSSPIKGQLIIDRWKKLENHPRVYLTSGTQVTSKSFLNFSLNNYAMAASDIVITHCTSSPTAEAICARKKAFWYESLDKHRGMDYDKIPGLMVHGYAELIVRVDNLLDTTTDAQYDAYLDQYVKHKIDAHLDRKAIDRFKGLLRA